MSVAINNHVEFCCSPACQAKLNELALLVSYHPTTVSKHTSGDRPLTREAAQAYAGVFKCDLLDVFLDPDELFPKASDSD